MDQNYFEFCCGVFPTHNLTPTQAVYAVALNFYGNDWTDTQDVMEQGLDRNIFFHPQYGALSTHSSVAIPTITLAHSVSASAWAGAFPPISTTRSRIRTTMRQAFRPLINSVARSS